MFPRSVLVGLVRLFFQLFLTSCQPNMAVSLLLRELWICSVVCILLWLNPEARCCPSVTHLETQPHASPGESSVLFFLVYLRCGLIGKYTSCVVLLWVDQTNIFSPFPTGFSTEDYLRINDKLSTKKVIRERFKASNENLSFIFLLTSKNCSHFR